MPRFNPAIAGVAPPPIPFVQDWARSYDGRHGALIDLSQAVPGYAPHPDLLAALAGAAGSASLAGYGPIVGETVLREAYAAHVSEVYGADIAAGDVHITAGCNQAFFATVMALAGHGEAVLLTNPFYFNHDTTLSMLGIRTATVDLDPAAGFLPDPDAVGAAIAPDVRALALVSPNNPTGAVCGPDRLGAIYDVCAARNIWLVLDETYRDFLPPDAGAPHRLFAHAGWRDRLVQLYSFSKSFCIPGHRVGAVVAGPALVDQIAKVMDNLQICAPKPAQVAVARTLAPLAGWRTANAAEIARRADAFRVALGSVPGWEIAALGAYFAYVRHPFAGENATAVAERLAREAGVITLPGPFFGTGQEDFLRMAFANADVAAIAGLPARLVNAGH